MLEERERVLERIVLRMLDEVNRVPLPEALVDKMVEKTELATSAEGPDDELTDRLHADPPYGQG